MCVCVCTKMQTLGAIPAGLSSLRACIISPVFLAVALSYSIISQSQF